MDKNDQKEEIKQGEDVIAEDQSENRDTMSDAAADQVAEENQEDSSITDSEEDKISKLEAAVSEQKDKYIRLYSEFENFRRRTAKEKLEMIQSASEHLIRLFLPVIDDFERAEKSFRDKKDKDLEGFFLIHNKFKKILDQSGVKAMDIKAGTDFNADLHEAITQIPAPEEKLKGKIVDVIEKGYLLNDKVIRFAKVVIGS